MATSKSSPPPPARSADATADQQDAAAPEPTGRYEYIWGDPTQYPHIPLTAYPARPALDAVEAAPGVIPSPAIPPRPATVFAFPDGPPDQRWRETDLPVNQARDNEPALPVKGA